MTIQRCAVSRYFRSNQSVPGLCDNAVTDGHFVNGSANEVSEAQHLVCRH
jgi:hypothetical protein